MTTNILYKRCSSGLEQEQLRYESQAATPCYYLDTFHNGNKRSFFNIGTQYCKHPIPKPQKYLTPKQPYHSVLYTFYVWFIYQ